MSETRDAVATGIVFAIEDAVLDSCARHGVRLTEEGFSLAFAREIRKVWPNISVAEAARWLPGYTGCRFGDPAYDWTYGGAAHLARGYIAEYGDQP